MLFLGLKPEFSRVNLIPENKRAPALQDILGTKWRGGRRLKKSGGTTG